MWLIPKKLGFFAKDVESAVDYLSAFFYDTHDFNGKYIKQRIKESFEDVIKK